MDKKAGWKNRRLIIRILRILMQVCFWGCVTAGGIMIITGILLFVKPFFFLHVPGNSLGLFGRIRFEMNGFLLYSLGNPVINTPLPDRIANFQTVEKVVFFFNAIPSFAFALFFHQFYHLLWSVEKGKPFTAENAKRLTLMGLVPIILSIAIQLTRVVIALIYDLISDIPFSVELGGVFFGLVLLILARVFKHGHYLQEEYDATL